MKSIFPIQDLKSRLEDLKSGKVKSIELDYEMPLTKQQEYDLHLFVNNIIPENRVYQKFKWIEIIKELLVIQLKDVVIGVASTQSKVMEMISDYIDGDDEIINIKDIRDSGIEFTCEVYNHKVKCTETITVFNFTLNEL